MTKIDLDLAVKLDGSETHMTAIFIDSWGDKLVVPLNCETHDFAANYFTPCAHCGNAVLDCNFNNGSDCCDRCTEGNYPTKQEDIKMETTLVKNRVVVNQNLTISERTSLAVEAGVSAFWETIAASFPDSNGSGDLTPHSTMLFENGAEMAVKEWIEFNVPKKECYRGEIGYFDELHLHYRDVWHQLHTGGGCMVAVTDNIAIDGSYRYMGVTSDCVCIYTDTFEEDDFLMEHMEDCTWSFGENPTTLMNIIDEMFGGSALWNTGHLFDDIMTLGKSGKC
jgi:hypothetical protein